MIQKVKKEATQLATRVTKLSEDQTSLSLILKNLEDSLSSHSHGEYITLSQLRENIKKAIDNIPPPPLILHEHPSKDIKDLAKTYDLAQLKIDHPDLREPFLHPPKRHTHTVDEILGLVEPRQINKIGLDADTLDGYHIKDLLELVRRLTKNVYVGGGSIRGNAGMTQHGNEFHTPDFSEVGHTHTESNITDLSHDATKIKGKIIDSSAIGNDKALVYKAASDKIEFISTSGGIHGNEMHSVPFSTKCCQICETASLPADDHPGHAWLLTSDSHIYVCIDGTADMPCGGCTFENVLILPVTVELGEGVFLTSDKHIYIGV